MSTATFTPMELRTIRYVCQGLRNKDICKQARWALPTVKHHISNVLAKIGGNQRAAIIVYAIRNRLYCPWCDL